VNSRLNHRNSTPVKQDYKTGDKRNNTNGNTGFPTSISYPTRLVGGKRGSKDIAEMNVGTE